MSKALTLIEALVVVGILAVLVSLTPFSLDFYKSYQLDVHTQGIIRALRRAQLKAMSVELDSNFGVYLSDNDYTLFKGSSYENRDVPYDEVFDLPLIITVSGLSEIVFSKAEGTPEEALSYCGGNCLACSEFIDRKLCNDQDGCGWDNKQRLCIGACAACDGFLGQGDCEDQLGCIWYSAGQGGNIVLSSGGDSRTINVNKIGRVNLE